MTSKFIPVVVFCGFSQLVSGALVSLGSYNSIAWHSNDAPFFDASVEDWVTPYAATSFFDTATMVLREYRDASGSDYKQWEWEFDVYGLLEFSFGSYYMAAPLTQLSIQVAHNSWNGPEEFFVNINPQTYVNPNNPDSIEAYDWSIPFTTNGTDFRDLREESPLIYAGGSVGVTSTFLHYDPNDPFPFVDPKFMTEDWMREKLWTEILYPDRSYFSTYMGSYSEASPGWGGAGGYADQWNGGWSSYSYRDYGSSPSTPVPDSGTTASLLASSIGLLLWIRRRFTLVKLSAV